MLTEKKLYYLSPQVRSRIVEYCGGSTSRAASCTTRFIVTDGETVSGLGIPQREVVAPPADLDRFLSRGTDVFRSL